MKMNHTVSAIIDKLRTWCSGQWKPYCTNSKSTSFILRLHYEQLFILSDNKVLESLNLNGKMKAIYKDDVLILIFPNAIQQIRKIKFQIKTNIKQCLLKLGLHLPVVNYNSIQATHQTKCKSIEEILEIAIRGKATNKGPPLPPVMKDFVKLCLLDPTFPQVVSETENILKDIAI